MYISRVNFGGILQVTGGAPRVVYASCPTVPKPCRRIQSDPRRTTRTRERKPAPPRQPTQQTALRPTVVLPLAGERALRILHEQDAWQPLTQSPGRGAIHDRGNDRKLLGKLDQFPGPDECIFPVNHRHDSVVRVNDNIAAVEICVDERERAVLEGEPPS
jgi:hypothetical protein